MASKFRRALRLVNVLCLSLSYAWASAAAAEQRPKRIGVIGADTVHAIAFTEIINDPKAEGLAANYQVVAGCVHIQSDYGHVEGWDVKMCDLGVELKDTLDELLASVDYVLVLSNDGQAHVPESLAAIRAGKTLFVDKPVAGNLVDAFVIYQEAMSRDVPIFSASSLRFTKTAQAIVGGSIGPVLGADTFSPAPLDPMHTDFFWYGIHGVEPLFTVMGVGCETVSRTHTDDFDVALGRWADGRIGTFRGTRKGPHAYGGTAFGAEGHTAFGAFEGYQPLVVEILRFFETGRPPVAPDETLEIYAFMEAADESKRRGGVPVAIRQVLEQARVRAEALWSKHELDQPSSDSAKE